VACPQARVCRVGQVYTLVGLVIDSDLATLSDMSDSLFTAPLIEMHVYYYDDG
jgi:hypothetical protein